MSSTNLVPHKALLKAGVATALIAAAAPAVAQQDTTTMETIVVTGSRIARPELQASSPVTVVGGEEFQFAGAVHVEEVLADFPQIVPVSTAASNNPGSGAATVSMRGLGSTRTLVLVNGRRYVSYDENQIVDLNTIPSALVERVDVVTGGRSAVYGSDAVAGVINFVLKKDFEGVEVGSSYRLTEKGDGDIYSIDGTIGGNFADGKGNATVFMNYSKRKSIFASARDFSKFALGDDGKGGFVPGGSTTTPAGRIVLPGGRGTMAFDENGNMRPYVASDGYNFAPDNYLQVPNERWFVGANAHYTLNDHFEAYTEILYVNSRAQRELAPTPVSGNSKVDINSQFLSPSARAILAAIDAAETTNPLTGVVQGDGYVIGNVQRRVNETGSRQQMDDRNAFRALIGLRGDIAGGWAYDTYYSYARNRNIQTQEGNIATSRWNAALETWVNPETGAFECRSESARAQGCVPLNIFGPGKASAEAINYITVPTTNLNAIQSQVANFTVNNGNLFDLGAGPAGIALGFEWRSERGSYRPDFYLSSGDVQGFNAGQPTNGGWSVKELYGEVVVPLLAERPFFHNLEFNGALRYSDYSNAVGSAWTYSAGLMWAPVEDITFRGQYQRAVRAPTVADLYSGQYINFPNAQDPCDLPAALSNSSLNATCRAQGVPADMIGKDLLQGTDTQIRSIYGGNRDLHEETSDTYTVGVVVQPRFLPRFSMTVDYYNITVEDNIGAPTVPRIIAACYGDENNGFVPYDSSFCALAPRNSISYRLEDPINTNANLGFLKTQGLDFDLKYWMDVPFGFENDGRLDFRLNATRVLSFKSNSVASIPALMLECEGHFGSQCGTPMPKWRGSSRVTYSTGPLSTSLGWTYWGKVTETNPAAYSTTKIGGYSLFDMAVTYQVADFLTMGITVNNLFDKKPPIVGGNAAGTGQNNTYPVVYDVFGRQYYLSARVKF